MSSDLTIKIDTSNFLTEVLQSKEPVVVDFWAAWCSPCRMIAPFLEEIAVEFEGKVKVAKINVDDNPELAGHYGVRSIPTLAIFKDGAIEDLRVGAASKASLKEWVSGIG